MKALRGTQLFSRSSSVSWSRKRILAGNSLLFIKDRMRPKYWAIKDCGADGEREGGGCVRTDRVHFAAGIMVGLAVNQVGQRVRLNLDRWRDKPGPGPTRLTQTDNWGQWWNNRGWRYVPSQTQMFPFYKFTIYKLPSSCWFPFQYRREQVAESWTDYTITAWVTGVWKIVQSNLQPWFTRGIKRLQTLPLPSHGQVSGRLFSLSDRGTPDLPPYPWAGLSSFFPEALERIKERGRSGSWKVWSVEGTVRHPFWICINA